MSLHWWFSLCQDLHCRKKWTQGIIPDLYIGEVTWIQYSIQVRINNSQVKLQTETSTIILDVLPVTFSSEPNETYSSSTLNIETVMLLQWQWKNTIINTKQYQFYSESNLTNQKSLYWIHLLDTYFVNLIF